MRDTGTEDKILDHIFEARVGSNGPFLLAVLAAKSDDYMMSKRHRISFNVKGPSNAIVKKAKLLLGEYCVD